MDADFKIKDKFMIRILEDVLEDYRRVISSLEMRMDFFSCEDLRNYLRDKDGDIDFVKFCSGHIEQLRLTYYPGTLFKAPVDHLIVKSKEYRRLGVWMYAIKNTFYVQFAYRIMPGADLEASYKILKQVNGKFDVIATNLDHTVNNKEAWKKLFPHDPYIPTYND